MNTDAISKFTLCARDVLTEEIGEQLTQIYGLRQDGSFAPARSAADPETHAEIQQTRSQLEKLLADEKDAGIKPSEAVAKLVKETAFTHLNRLVALKMLEHPDRKLIRRAALAGYPEPNGFRMWVTDDPGNYELYQKGASPLDEREESPRDRAYRHFLFWQCGKLAREVRVLFDPDNLASRLFPRPKTLRLLLERLHSEDLQEAWKPGNEETIGSVYQAFNANELEEAFSQARLSNRKFSREDIPSVTQLFTPRFAVRFLVDNTLGRLWLEMHPDSRLRGDLSYFVDPAKPSPQRPLKSVAELRILDPACGTMHFGLLAFDLLVKMYQEEMARCGEVGWPDSPPVEAESDIPASILAKNLFGIDIDLRAVQLSALALYVRAKSYSRDVKVTESNLACADVALFRGAHRNQVASEMELPQGITRQLFEQFCDALDEAGLMGSLVRIECIFERKLNSEDLKQAIDKHVELKAQSGIDESYFEGEASKGLRLLEVLTGRYDVVFTNPPYLSARKMNSEMSRFVKTSYREGKGDLYACFIQRCSELTAADGLVGMLTMHSFMFISSFEKLREQITRDASIQAVAHYGPALFAVGNPGTLQTVAFVLRQESFANLAADSVGVYFRLVKEPDIEAKRAAFENALATHQDGSADSRVYEYRQGDFAAIPGGPWAYWADDRLRSLFAEFPPLGDLYTLDMGLKTSSNVRFVRSWWEVGRDRLSSPVSREQAIQLDDAQWFWYTKSGKGEGKSQLRFVVNWKDDGRELKEFLNHQYPYLNGRVEWCTHNEELYFKPCLTWSPVSSTGFKARIVPSGAITSNAAYGIFCSTSTAATIYAYLQSIPGRYLVRLLCPTINHNKGDIERVPISSQLLTDERFSALAAELIDSIEDTDLHDETAARYRGPGEVSGSSSSTFKTGAIDEFVARSLGLESQSAFMTEFLQAPLDDSDVANEEGEDSEDSGTGSSSACPSGDFPGEWVSYSVGVALGRFHPGVLDGLGCGSFSDEIAGRLRELADPEGLTVLEEGHPDDLAQRVSEILHVIHGDAEAERLLRAALGSSDSSRDAIEKYLIGAFFRDHVTRYRKRPVYWLLQSPKRNYQIYVFHEKVTADTLPAIRGPRYLGGRIYSLEKAHERFAREKQTRQANETWEALEDLREFDRLIEKATRFPIEDKYGRETTVRWEPELDDGVYINAAPLRGLMPAWRVVKLDKAWQELADGKYDWSKTAMRYWPKRVLEACKTNKSFRIAHGLE